MYTCNYNRNFRWSSSILPAFDISGRYTEEMCTLCYFLTCMYMCLESLLSYAFECPWKSGVQRLECLQCWRVSWDRGGTASDARAPRSRLKTTNVSRTCSKRSPSFRQDCSARERVFDVKRQRCHFLLIYTHTVQVHAITGWLRQAFEADFVNLKDSFELSFKYTTTCTSAKHEIARDDRSQRRSQHYAATQRAE